MFKLLTAVMAVFLCLSFGANARDKPPRLTLLKGDKCLMVAPTIIMLDDFIEQVERRTSNAMIVRLKGNDAKKYMALMNAIPPITHARPPNTLVITAVRPNLIRYGLTGFGKSGCLIGSGSIKADVHQRIMNKIKGQPA